MDLKKKRTFQIVIVYMYLQTNNTKINLKLSIINLFKNL